MVTFNIVSFQNLTGLRLKYNSLNSIHFITLCPVISTFKNITALDLSCNLINLNHNDEACDKMANLFSDLDHLVRLDLSNNRLRGKLRRILTCVTKPLQYLKLTACGLMLTDLTYLAVSHHTDNLEELDVSENHLGNCITALVHLLKNIHKQVCVLELEDVTLLNHHCIMLCTSLRTCTSLLYLNIMGNRFTKENTLCVAQSIAGLSSLQCLCLSYPSDCYLGDLEEELEPAQKQFAVDFGDIIYRQQQHLGIPNRIPNVVFSEIDPSTMFE